MMEEISPQLKDGSEWADHEDCIVGDEQGLKNLIKACETALEKGEYYGNDLGDYVGIKKLDNSWLKNPTEPPQSRFIGFIIATVLLTILALILIGLNTVWNWFF